jgi:hypothetical protein
MIVPGGGLSRDGTRWISARPGFLLPVRVLAKLFRRLFLAGLTALHAAGALAFFGTLTPLSDPGAFARALALVGRKRWVVYAKPPFAGPAAVLAYLSRYTVPNQRYPRPETVPLSRSIKRGSTIRVMWRGRVLPCSSPPYYAAISASGRWPRRASRSLPPSRMPSDAGRAWHRAHGGRRTDLWG